MPRASEQEIQGILDAIKAMTGGYVARGEYVDQSPRMSKHDPSRQAFDYEIAGDESTKYELYDYSEPKPYEHTMTRDEFAGILRALSMQPHYRTMPEAGTPEFDAELMRRYPQMFGLK